MPKDSYPSRRPRDYVANRLSWLSLPKVPAGGGSSSPSIKVSELRTGVTAKSGRVAKAVPPQNVIDDVEPLFSWTTWSKQLLRLLHIGLGNP